MTRPLKERPEPYITLNAFGHYVMTSDAHERRAILRGMKFFHPGKQSQYSAAVDAVTRYLTDPARDVGVLHRVVARLQAEKPSGEHDAVRRRICCEAIACVLSSAEGFEYGGLILSRACLRRHRIRAGGVVISCYPEILIRGTVRKRKLVGALKLRFAKRPTFDDEA